MKVKKNSFKYSVIYSSILLQLTFPFILPGNALAQTPVYEEMAVQSVKLQSGQTVSDIAKKNHLSVDHLWEVNSFAFSNKDRFMAAHEGDKIWVPANKNGREEHEMATTLPTAALHSANKGNERSTDALQLGRSQLSSMAGKQVESLLSKFGGSSRVSLGGSKDFNKLNYAADVLVPVWDSRQDFLLFSQLGGRRIDDRTTVNVGFGGRYFTDSWMLGNNMFYDYDLTGVNRRLGVGMEYWTNALRLSANGYFGLSGWHQSKVLTGYNERPANGWDVELQSWLPTYPQLGGTLKYEQYYGDEVALISRNNRKHNPAAISGSVNWTPVPLISLETGYRKSPQGGDDTSGVLNLNWNIGRSWAWHVSPQSVSDMRSLTGGRYDLVTRNNQIVLDYKQQTVITLSTVPVIRGEAGSTHSLGVKSWAKYGLSRIDWDDTALKAVGGKIIDAGSNAHVKLPDFKPGASNRYVVSGVAYDNKGNASNRAQVEISVIESSQPGDIESFKLDLNADQKLLAAGQVLTLTTTVTDQNGKPKEGAEVNFLSDNDSAKPIAENNGITNAEGIAKARVTITEAGNYNFITQYAGQSSQKASASVTADVTSATVTESKGGTIYFESVNDPDQNSIAITMTLKDKYGNPVTHKEVSFRSIDRASGVDQSDWLSVDSTKTDENGVVNSVAKINGKPAREYTYDVHAILDGQQLSNPAEVITKPK